MAKVFQAPAILSRIGFTKDGGLSLGFQTNELSAQEKITAAEYHGRFGYLLFKENQFADTEIPEEDAPTDEEKTPSQRLRAALFVLWTQRGSKGEFTEFYRTHMERAIARVKQLLD